MRSSPNAPAARPVRPGPCSARPGPAKAGLRIGRNSETGLKRSNLSKMAKTVKQMEADPTGEAMPSHDPP